ncbi:unnamed protein product [Malus baccata var. baccata]
MVEKDGSAKGIGTRWTGKCWYVYNLLKYKFDLQFNIPITYPATAPELELPLPRFSMAHALCLGLAPWLAAFMLIRIAHSFSFLYEVYEKRIVAEAGCFTVFTVII